MFARCTGACTPSLLFTSYEGLGMRAFTKKEMLQELITYLRDLSEGEMPPEPCLGVCNAIETWLVNHNVKQPSYLYPPYGVYLGVRDYCREAMENWPHNIGSLAYPIGGLAEYSQNKELWDGDSGLLRQDLCEWIAEALEELL